jgi:hypothetical protein
LMEERPALVPNFAGFFGDCRRSQTAWRRGGFETPKTLPSLHALQACALNQSFRNASEKKAFVRLLGRAEKGSGLLPSRFTMYSFLVLSVMDLVFERGMLALCRAISEFLGKNGVTSVVVA